MIGRFVGNPEFGTDRQMCDNFAIGVIYAKQFDRSKRGFVKTDGIRSALDGQIGAIVVFKILSLIFNHALS